ncbi:single-stranded DNA-binding protein [Marinobacterium weihaiense]|uniref:Single-stranded DNA-binding protein n=1 Tax=Marinobacterium weihaiense TaxID=2851016 RepID=A0ABS6MDF3_9GAMM|nr:single-stranded DNA-binding protein [Marinobacterium weihaiense]MBV0934185.1 single-stranded DNA-binding protein [Marinobacterium weihaiense]
MAQGVNRVILIGRCGQDPQIKTLQGGQKVVNISLATSESWMDRQTNERKERTEWHRVVIFGQLADIAAQHLQKGRQIYLEGSLRTRSWTDNNGNQHYMTEVVAKIMQILDSNQGNLEKKQYGNIDNNSTSISSDDKYIKNQYIEEENNQSRSKNSLDSDDPLYIPF